MAPHVACSDLADEAAQVHPETLLLVGACTAACGRGRPKATQTQLASISAKTEIIPGS